MRTPIEALNAYLKVVQDNKKTCENHEYDFLSGQESAYDVAIKVLEGKIK